MKTKILRNLFLSLSAIFALSITAHAQNLYVSAQVPGGQAPHQVILEFTPLGVQTTYASKLSFPRGLAFDSMGNFFAAESIESGHDLTIGKVLLFNLRNKATTLGSAANFFFEGLAIDIAGNAYVMANDDTSPTVASTIFKFTPSGEKTIFGSIPSQGWGLAFDSAGNLYAAEGSPDTGDRTIYRFAPAGTQAVFAGTDAFPEGVFPIGLAFDSSGNLFVSTECFCDPGNDTILEFTSDGMESTFATGLTFPRGLAFDSSGNLFVAEANAIPDGDILEFLPDGTEVTPAFASGFGRPEFLTFGPPR